MSIRLFEESKEEKALKKYRKDTNNRVLLYLHTVSVLVIYELLLILSYNPRVVMYNGVDIWFQAAHILIPGGTFIVSLMIILYRGFYLFLDLKGIKDKKEVKEMKKEKKPIKINWSLAMLMVFEGFLWGSLIYIFLPPTSPAIIKFLFGDFTLPTPIDANDTLWNYHTNVLQDIALAFGSGFYDEMIFREKLSAVLLPVFKKRAKTTSTSIDIPVIKRKITLLTVKDNQKVNYGVMITGAFIFSISHYLLPYSDAFNIYGIVYRFLFGIILYIIYKRFRFPVAMWTHIFYDLWYFVLT